MNGSAAPNVDETATAGETTYQRIRTDIMFGHLPPGDRLRLERLRARYSTSVSTLREVLYRLSSEGLVTAEGQRGFEVAPVSAANFREVAVMRNLLEGHALQVSFASGDIEWEARVVSAHHKLARLEARMLAGDKQQMMVWKRYDREFHHALISACGSRALMETHGVVFDQFLRYQVLAVLFRGEKAVAEHRRLLEFALARDAQQALSTLTRHIESCVEDTLARGVLA